MMNNPNRTIHLNRQILTAAFIRRLQPHELQKMSAWEQDIFCFLQQWFDESDHIEVHTSGSTGKPQRLFLSKKAMRCSAQATNQFFKLEKSSQGLLCLSANYIAGKMMLVRAIEGEYQLWTIAPSSQPLKNWSRPIDFSAMVPMQVEETLKNGEVEALQKIKTLIIGGGAISPSLERQINSLFSMQCYATYGMTETASHVALRRLTLDNESIYQALPGISFSIDERSCLIVNAPNLLDHPLVTNDVVELKADNTQFIWKGRYDFVVNSGGIKLFPETIEKKIASLFPDRPFYLTKKSDERLGEALVLVVEGEPFSKIESHRLLQQITVCVSPYEKPRSILFLPRFERTVSGKVIRLKNC